jgi:hypothetical protein
MTIWLVKRDPKSAVDIYGTSALSDERFFPALSFDSAEYAARFAGDRALQPAESTSERFKAAMTAYLEKFIDRRTKPPQSLADIVGPFSPAIAQQQRPGLWPLISAREPRALDKTEAITYVVRDWRDMAWTSSPTVGFREALPSRLRKGWSEPQAVIFQARPVSKYASPQLFFLLWVNEVSDGRPQWRLWSVELPPVS